jgi:hypothetical protein
MFKRQKITVEVSGFFPHAACERCGIALCNDHILENNKKYYCKEHLK